MKDPSFALLSRSLFPNFCTKEERLKSLEQDFAGRLLCTRL
jgi:hypothetical protein